MFHWNKISDLIIMLSDRKYGCTGNATLRGVTILRSECRSSTAPVSLFPGGKFLCLRSLVFIFCTLFLCRTLPAIDWESFPGPEKGALNLLGLESEGGRRLISAGQLSGPTLDAFQIALLKENGLRHIGREIWKSEAGRLQGIYYFFPDGKAAYSSYTFLKPEGTVSLLQAGKPVETDAGVFFWQANLVVHLRSESKDPAMVRKAFSLASFLARTVSLLERSEVPPLMYFLPRRGEDTGGRRYLLGVTGLRQMFSTAEVQWPGFEDSAEVAVSDYLLAGKSCRLFLIGYPNANLAKEHFGRIETFFGGLAATGQKFYLKQNRLLAAVLTGTADAAPAQELLSEIEYSYSVKWIYDNRPPELMRSESVSLIGVVVRSLLLLVLMALIAVVLGCLIGGGMFLVRDHQSNLPLHRSAHWKMIRPKFTDR